MVMNTKKAGTLMAAEQRQSEVQAQRNGKRTRLMIDISPELRRRIKVAAAQRDLSVREYVERLLEEAVPAEEQVAGQSGHPITPPMLEHLLKARQAINQGQTFPDSTEIIRQMREERTEYLMQLCKTE
jgi:predicted metal-dependent RNase